MQARLDIAVRLEQSSARKARSCVSLEFDEGMTYEEMYQEVGRTLLELSASGNPITIAYIGKTWTNRAGIYDSIANFDCRTGIKTRVGVSVGLNMADIQVLASLDATKIRQLQDARNRVEQFFTKHPKGKMMTISQDRNWGKRVIEMKYDTRKASLKTETGVLEDDRPNPLERKAKEKISNLINIPGGEGYLASYPFRSANGEFVASGILFEVKNGYVVKFHVPHESHDLGIALDESQLQLLDLISSGHRIPLSEIGLGFYAYAGLNIDTSQLSILTYEKTGPHFGIGTPASKTTEHGIINKMAGMFNHTDFVLSDPSIMLVNDAEEPCMIGVFPQLEC
jgi:hypothetical protein